MAIGYWAGFAAIVSHGVDPFLDDEVVRARPTTGVAVCGRRRSPGRTGWAAAAARRRRRRGSPRRASPPQVIVIEVPLQGRGRARRPRGCRPSRRSASIQPARGIRSSSRWSCGRPADRARPDTTRPSRSSCTRRASAPPARAAAGRALRRRRRRMLRLAMTCRAAPLSITGATTPPSSLAGVLRRRRHDHDRREQRAGAPNRLARQRRALQQQAARPSRRPRARRASPSPSRRSSSKVVSSFGELPNVPSAIGRWPMRLMKCATALRISGKSPRGSLPVSSSTMIG